MKIQRLNLSNFRNYDAARIDIFDASEGTADAVVITGANGAGKTNILEAISLLSPGKGLRSAELSEIKNRNSAEEEVWTVSSEIIDDRGIKRRIGTGFDRQSKKRIVRIDGIDAKNQSELGRLLSVIWLTPQMDRLFIDAAGNRRKFLDRLVAAYNPEHVEALVSYEKFLRERLKLLQGIYAPDKNWLTKLEAQAAEKAVVIAASRNSLIDKLQEHVKLLRTEAPLFPIPSLVINNWVEKEMRDKSAAEVEEMIKEKFASSRRIDAESKRTSSGVHRSDFEVTYADKNIAAAQSSTGEQKALLVAIILGHALMMRAERGFAPIILLDEVAAHLDQPRREMLLQILSSLKGQVWLTGTESGIFSSLDKRACFITVEGGRVFKRDVF